MKLPQSFDELDAWMTTNNVDRIKFNFRGGKEGPDQYYILHVGRFWTVTYVHWKGSGVVASCDSEKDVCECFAEVILGIDYEANSRTRKCVEAMTQRIEQSWPEDMRRMQW